MDRTIALADVPRAGEDVTTEQTRTMRAEDFCTAYSERVFRFASMVSRGEVDAEDLAQDALERAIRALDSFDPVRGNMSAWLWRIVVRVAVDHGRLARRRHLLYDRLIRYREEPAATASPDPDVPAGELLAAVRRLPPRDREIVALHYGAGLSYIQVAEALGISPAAAGVAGRRAVARLRTMLTDPRRSHS